MKKVNEEILYDIAELFKVFGDSTRIKIIKELFKQELNVQDIAENLNMTQSAVSHQLKILRNAKLVKTNRKGKNMYYSLADEHVEKIFNLGYEHIIEDRGDFHEQK